MTTEEKTKQDFYGTASDWAYDMYQSQSIWLRRSLFSLVVLAILLMMSLLANLFLVPLKEKVPYLYAFDHSTGEVTKVGILDSTTLSANWEVSRYFLIHYVIQAESYDVDNVEQPYQMVWAQSAENVRKQYESQVKSSNTTSPYYLYGKDKYITVRVLAVNRLNENTVDVKFEKTMHDRSAMTEQVIQKEAIIKWKYSQVETTQKMLDRDPLGFTVTYYQVSQVNLDKTF